MIKIKILIIMVIFLLPFSAQAAIYYVDGESGLDTNPGTITNPWKSLHKANTTLVSGDTVYIRGGTEDYEVYDVTASSGAGEGIQPDNSGTGSGDVITYSVYPGEMVHLQGVADSGTTCYGILIAHKDYIKVTGVSNYNLKISEMTGGIVIGEVNGGSDEGFATGNEVCHVWVTEIGNAASWSTRQQNNMIWKGAQYNHLHDCKFTDHGYLTTSNILLDMFSLGKEFDYSPTSDYYNVIEDCEFGRAGHSVITFGSAKFNMFRNNYLHNEEWFDVGGSDYSFRVVIAYGRNGYTGYNVIEGNRVGYGGKPHPSSGQSAGPGFKWCQQDDMLRYNSFFGNDGGGMYFSAYSSGGNYAYANRNYVYNNTFYYNGYNSSKQGFEFWNTGDWTAQSDNVLKNNLFWDNYNYARPYAGIYLTVNPTNCLSCPSSSSQGCNTVSDNFNGLVSPASKVDPVFVNTSLADSDSWTLPNLNLQPGSPAIDGGTYLTQANGSGSNSTTLIVDDAHYFQDGKFGSASGCDSAKWPSGVNIQADWIAIGTVDNIVQISSIDYSTNTITLVSPMAWQDNAPIWLYKKSDGKVVLNGTAPDMGAHEYPISPPQNLRIVQ